MDNEAYRKKIDLIRHYVNINSVENTRLVCLDALKDNPHDGFVLRVLTGAYYDLKDYDACVQTGIESLPYQNPSEQAETYNLLAAVYYNKKNFENAAEYSQKAVEAAPVEAHIIATHAKNLANLERLDEARILFDRAEEIEPQNYYVIRDKLHFYRDFCQQREVEESILARLIAVSSSPYDLNWQFALIHMKYHEYQDAHNYLVKALLLKPGSEACKDWIQYCEDMISLGRATKGIKRKNRKVLIAAVLIVVSVLIVNILLVKFLS
jgi:tetratricopeptide (TPR) repeat protein